MPSLTLSNPDIVPSPALLVYTERVEENLRRMISTAGNRDRLRPHIKTHKMPDIMRTHLALGITKFKAATIAEAEMAAQTGAPDVLLAYQPVGPNIARFIELCRRYPATKFSAVVDDREIIAALGAAAKAAGTLIELLLDIDCGQRRSGVLPGVHAVQLYHLLHSTPGLSPGGLHAYDGHIHDTDIAVRTATCNAAFAPVESLRVSLLNDGLQVPRFVVGGTPTFPIHAKRGDVECSPGTCVLWDYSYSSTLLDMDFVHAAAVLTRVVSKPADGRICLDLGHKAIASENPHPRVYFPDVPDATFVGHSEEHLVLQTSRADQLRIGHPLVGIPWHICPTVALHAEAVVVENGLATQTRWNITARARRLNV
jgi:D-threonine aldolase